MRPHDRVTILVYATVLGAVLVATAVAGRGVLFERYTARAAPLVVSAGDDVLVLAGRSQSGETYNDILLVDVERRRIQRLTEVDAMPRGVSAAATGGRLYLLGGSSGGRSTDAILEIDIESKEMVAVGTLPAPVAWGAAAAAGGRLYYAGGFDGEHRRDEIVGFDPATGTSEVIGHLPAPRDNLCAAATDESLYVFGGDGPNNEAFSDLLEVDLRSGTVVRSWAVPQALSLPSMVIQNDTVVILGAAAGDRGVLVTLEIPARDDRSPRLRPVEVDGRTASIATVAGRIFAVGGADRDRRRQLAVQEILPGSRDPRPLSMSSRVWY